MKEFINWVVWMFKGLQLWQWVILTSLVLNIGSAFLPDPYHWYVNAVGMAMILSCFFKWFVYDMLKASWVRYKAQRNELFNTIKESEQKV